MAKNKIIITENKLKQIVAESVKKVISELDLKTFPKGDYRERNEWWKTQTNNDFPNFKGDSKDWQSTYNSLDSEKKAKEAEVSKMVKKEWCSLKNIDEVLTGDDVAYDGIMELPLYTNDFELVIFHIDSFTKPLGKNNNFIGITVGYGGFIKETGEQCEITLKVKVSKTNIKVKIITNSPNIDTTLSTNEVIKTIRNEAMAHCESKF